MNELIHPWKRPLHPLAALAYSLEIQQRGFLCKRTQGKGKIRFAYNLSFLAICSSARALTPSKGQKLRFKFRAIGDERINYL